jgi:GNAT superfamily N-acetyltransferase
VKRFLIVNARKLLEAFRKKREFYRPIGKILRNLDVSDVVMRPAQKSDIQLIELLLTHGDYTKHRTRIQDQEEGRVTYIFAWAWGRIPIGHILIHWGGGEDGPLKDLDDKGPLMEDLVVHPAVWRKGIGSMLMDEAEGLIESRGNEKVGFTLYTLNPAVMRLYEPRGYQPANLAPYVTERIFTNRRGKKRKWTRRGRYMVKQFKEKEHGSEG